MYDKWLDYIKNANEEDLVKEIDYKNEEGIAYANTPEDIMSQLLTHGTYHRGQINNALKANNLKPVTQDYIFYVRQGKKL